MGVFVPERETPGTGFHPDQSGKSIPFPETGANAKRNPLLLFAFNKRQLLTAHILKKPHHA